MFQDSGCRAGFDNPAISEEGNIICHASGECHLMSNDDQFSTLLTQFFDRAENIRRCFRIEGGSRFIKKQ